MSGDAESHMYMSKDRLVTQELTVEKVQACMKQGYKNLSWEGVPARDRRLTECLTGIELYRKRTDGNGSVTQRPRWQRLLCAWGYSELCVSWPETS